MAIRAAFAIGGHTAAEKQRKHVPAGLTEVLDIEYDALDKDARLDIFLPAGAKPRTTIVWIHGGGFVGGSKADVANYARILASKGYGVASIEYSRAPEQRYPQPVEQANRALGWLSTNGLRHGLARDRFVLAGDSAGAQIAAQLANAITSPDYARTMGLYPTIAPQRLVGAVLFCGPFDGTLTYKADARPPWFVRTVMWAYMGRKDFWRNPRAGPYSVVHFVTGDFPPAFVSVGNGDPLRPHSVALVDALRAKDVRVDALLWPEGYRPALPHEYQMDLDSPEGREALRRVEAFLASLR